MCGIVGYIGSKQAQPLILEGLRRLEYRGYDSAGICTLDKSALHTIKKAGRVDALVQLLKKAPLNGHIGIGHTRWATHGAPVDINAHPHSDQTGKIALVHNGVIENYAVLKAKLESKGHNFSSSTDTEVLAHLVGVYYSGDLVEAVSAALRDVVGTYGIAVMHLDEPDVIVGARRGSPLLVGVGQGENFLASDVAAIVAHTREVVYLNDYDVVRITSEDYQICSLNAESVNRTVSIIDWKADAAEKGDFAHFMLKEIFEQPQAIENAMRGRISRDESTSVFGGLNLTSNELRSIDRIVLCACGSAWHAALVGEYLFEELARIPVEVEYASEFRYRNPPIDKHTLVFVISQSGETADTLAALRESRRKGHKTLAICNTVGSTIAREADGGIFMYAGPEIGVAATKSFTSQVTILALLALYMGRIRHLSSLQGSKIIEELEKIPHKISLILKQADAIAQLARKYSRANNFLFLGRQFNFPIALEGALKLKEISYIHAEGYPAAEMKHGPIALIDKSTPSFFIAPKDALYEKVMSNLEEVKARGGDVVAVATEGDEEILAKTKDVIFVPSAPDYLQPLLTVIPLQLFSYYVAVARGCDVDKPRNLAKSVTVE